ncbi:MAG: lasso peptide biosynthesis B2 protein [Candidatus Acidiferrales bacterium]
MFFRAVFLLPVTACALCCIGLQKTKRLVGSGHNAPRAIDDAAEEWRIAHAARRMTEAASRHGMVRGSCLSKSIILGHLLRRQGLDATVHVGGRKEGSSFEAHAWVELNGRVVNDSEDVRGRFAPFEGQVSGALNGEK